MQNFSYENEFYLHEDEPVGKTHFQLNGFASRLLRVKSSETQRNHGKEEEE